MSDYSAEAEFDSLDSARVHAPGFETFSGVVDPKPNLFRSDLSIKGGQAEHGRLVEILESEGVDVHHLHEDLDAGGRLDELLSTDVEIQIENPSGSSRDLKAEIRSDLEEISTREKLRLVACNATITRHRHDIDEGEIDGRGFGNERRDGSTILIEEPLSNLYFQRDQQLLTAAGPVMATPAFETRRGEVRICRAAWESIGAPIVEDVPDGLTVEGGDYIPAGDFALLGISATVGGEEKSIRTSAAAAQHLLERDAIGHDEVALVEAPYEADQKQQRKQGSDKESAMEIMHLDTWFNIPMEGVAVAREPLVEETDVHVYHRTADGYEHTTTKNFAAYLESKGYIVIPVEFEERAIATNFLTLDDGVVLAARYADSENRTLDRMRQAGIDIVPDGEGILIDELRSGYGGIHCMVTPLNRT
jgi:arginine deiminase